MRDTNVLGIGLYRIPVAARLAQIPTSTLRSWLKGYSYTFKGRRFKQPPRWATQVSPASAVIGFLDLVEARIIGLFRKRGVKWSTIAAAREAAKRQFGVTHPFASLRLQTDGRTIFHEIGKDAEDEVLVEITTSQRVFDPIIRPYIIQLDTKDDIAVRWWPLGKKREVVLDPERAFGKPIIASCGVPTAILAAAARGQGSIEAAAKWFEVSPTAVQDSVEFEKSLAA